MNLKLQRINNSRFSVRFCAVMKYHGIKTVGKACIFLLSHYTEKNLNSSPVYSVSVKTLVKELDNYIKEQIQLKTKTK